MSTSVRAFRGSVTSNYGPPTEAQLNKINKRLEKPLSQDEVFVFRAVASNRNRDSYYSIMGDSSLRNYADDYAKGQAFMNNHRTNERPTGRTFDAEFNRETGEVIVWTYTIRDLKLNEVATNDFIRGVESGLIQDVSIHFMGGRDICNICNKRLYSKSCRHMPGIEYEDEGKGTVRTADFTIEDAHAVELSDAWKGSTPDAGLIRKASLLRQQGVLDDKMVRELNSRYGTNFRSILEGEDYLKFDFEQDESDADQTITADGHVGADGDGPDDPSAVTGLPKNKPTSDAHVNDKSHLDGRTVMNKEEKETSRKLYTEMLETRSAELSPEDVESIKIYLREMEEGKDPLPPKFKKKGEEDDDEDDKPKRYLTPKNKEATVIGCLRALGDKMMPGQVNPGAMEPGKGDMAGMIMPGQEPLQTVSSEMFNTSDGEAIPTEGDLMKGLTDLNTPLLTINPSGVISFFFGGKGEVMNGAGVGDGGAVYVSDRSTEDGKEVTRVYEPIVSRLDDPETVRALVNMAIDGQRLRGVLYHSLKRYGCIVHGKRFDADLHLELARAMTTDKLERVVEDWKKQAQEKMRTNPETEMSVSEFTDGDIKARQTVAKGAHGKDTERKEPLHMRNSLFKS